MEKKISELSPGEITRYRLTFCSKKHCDSGQCPFLSRDELTCFAECAPEERNRRNFDMNKKARM